MNSETMATIARIKLENVDLVRELTDLVIRAEAAGELDLAVYDCFGEAGADEANAHENPEDQERALRSSEDEAASVNNEGPEAQICIIVDSHGVDDGERMVRDLIPSLSHGSR